MNYRYECEYGTVDGYQLFGYRPWGHSQGYDTFLQELFTNYVFID